jgi:transcriptional accessory protein Tex/SPT6
MIKRPASETPWQVTSAYMFEEMIQENKPVEELRQFFITYAVGTQSYIDIDRECENQYVDVYFKDRSKAKLTSKEWVEIRGW